MLKFPFLICVLLSVYIPFVAAQQFSSVPVDDPVYDILDTAQLRGWCSVLPGSKPYSEAVVAAAIHEILDTAENNLSASERDIIETALRRFEREAGWSAERGGYYYNGNGSERPPLRVDATAGFDARTSAGLYADGNHAIGYDISARVNLNGSLWDALSFRFGLFGIMGAAPLTERGEYSIGADWSGSGRLPTVRNIKTYGNYAFLPFSYRKRWDGSVYKPGNMTAEGLEGWPTSLAFGFGMMGEISAGFFDNGLNLRAGRMYREWAAMDTGSSLVLNSSARPFLGAEVSVKPLRWFSLSSLIGSLEMPNMDLVTQNIYGVRSDAVFQNMFSITMAEFDFKYVHIDAGTTVIWPKRWEIGYMFPLISHLFYQNNIGDNDNISLFGNIKLRYPGIGSLWFSLYIDEMSFGSVGPFTADFFNASRQMYAYQFGTKASLPWIPFTSISLRYTKIEPYSYTHQVVKTPWYDGYISEAYLNNGESLGYYLPPNSDEVHVRFDTMPIKRLQVHTQYQFIRHGADFGSRAVPGSSVYSELPPGDRNGLRKYFLEDGAYEWFHIVSVGVSYNFIDIIRFPLTVYANAGFVYSYFTDTDSPLGVRGSFSRVSTAEYKDRMGAVLSIGLRIGM